MLAQFVCVLSKVGVIQEMAAFPVKFNGTVFMRCRLMPRKQIP